MAEPRKCEVCPGFGPSDQADATFRATYPKERFPVTGKFRFDLCFTHAHDALRAGAVIVKLKEDHDGNEA